MKDNKLPPTDELIKERSDLLKFAEEAQNRILMSQQRIAFLNGVLSERGVNLDSLLVAKPDAKN